MSNTLKDKLDELMVANKIQGQTDLLCRIFKYNMKATLKDQNIKAYDWAQKQKANFSKMVNEGRKFPVDYLIGIEHVLNTSGDYLYMGSDEKSGFIPRGLRYTAYNDDPVGYISLMGESQDEREGEVVTSFDEYGNSLVDYIIKFKSINGIRFLVENYGYKYNPMYHHFAAKDNFHFYVHNNNAPMLIAKMIADNSDSDLFFAMFDEGLELLNNYFKNENDIFNSPEFVSLILENDKLFDAALHKVNYSIEFINQRKHGFAFDNNYFINPIISNLLNAAISDGLYCLKTGEKSNYFLKAERIARYALKHNIEQVEFISANMDDLRYGIKVDEENYLDAGSYRIGNLVIYEKEISSDLPEGLQDVLKKLSKFKDIIKELPKKVMKQKNNIGNSIDDFVNYILENTEICKQERYDDSICFEIQKLMRDCGNDEIKVDFANKMRTVIEKRISELDLKTYDGKQNYLGLSIAKTFVDLNEQSLNALK